MHPELSILIPSKNGVQTLPKLVAALESQLAPGDEIVVLDDGSTDGTRRLAGALGLRVVSHERSLGVAAARNRLARESTGSILVFFDDDVIPFPGYLAEVRTLFADPGVDVCQGAHHTSPADERPDVWQRCEALCWHYYMSEQCIELGLAHSLTSQSFCIRRDLFEKLGGFSERFQDAGGEEFDFTLRVLKDASIRFVPRLVSSHHFQTLFPRLRTLWRRSRHYAGIYSRMPASLRRFHRVEVLRCGLCMGFLVMLLLGMGGILGPGAVGAGLLMWLMADRRFWVHAYRVGGASLTPLLVLQRAMQYAVISAGSAARAVAR